MWCVLRWGKIRLHFYDIMQLARWLALTTTIFVVVL